ncbi:DUF6155 family protein [Longimicrobium sp.]|jgi:hypothetical protein|uniref:DUF6155 family protein n=1 Tax=Longimicrobium sp. TaxID=2029185 RepID=UPI002F940986
MSSIQRRELKAFLNQLSKEQIIEQVAALCDAVPQAADFYRTKLRAGDDAKVAEEYKEKIRREFARRSTGGFRLSSTRKLVTDFDKIAASAATPVDLMLTYVEEGLDAVLYVGALDASFANSMVSMYRNAVHRIVQHDLQAEYGARCDALRAKGAPLGWALGDGLDEIYMEYLFDDPLEA